MSDTAEPVVFEHHDVVVRRAGALAIVRLQGRAKGNPITIDSAAGVTAAVDHVATAGWARAVLLEASGPNFCVGGDVAAFAAAAAAGELAALVDRMIEPFHRSIEAIDALAVPVLAAVRGAVAGGGLSMLCACDVAIASETARVVFAYPAIGLSPDGGVSATLVRAVGLRRATDLALTGRVLSADEAHQWGLVGRVVADDRLEAVARAIGAGMAGGATAALAATKRLLRAGAVASLAEHLPWERASMLALAATRDAAEGTAAFLEKRPPAFRGVGAFDPSEGY